MGGTRKGLVPDPRPGHAACSVIPTLMPQHICRLGLAPGARTPLPQGLGPAQQSLRSEDFLYLRNMKKGTAALSHPAQPPKPTPVLGTAQPVWGASLPHCPPLLSMSPWTTVCLP